MGWKAALAALKAFWDALVKVLPAALAGYAVHEYEGKKRAKAELKSVEKANEVEREVDRMSDAAVHERLRKRWMRNVGADNPE